MQGTALAREGGLAEARGGGLAEARQRRRSQTGIEKAVMSLSWKPRKPTPTSSSSTPFARCSPPRMDISVSVTTLPPSGPCWFQARPRSSAPQMTAPVQYSLDPGAVSSVF